MANSGSKLRIAEVRLYLSDSALARAIREGGSTVQRIPPADMIARADADLHLHGRLKAFMEGKSPPFEKVPEMTDEQWAEFMNARCLAHQAWDRWFVKTSSAIYSVVVITTLAPSASERTASATTPAAEPPSRRKADGPGPSDKAKLLAKLKVLVAVAMADGTIDPRERALLESLCAKLGLSTEDLEKLFAQRMSVDRKDLPKSKNEKRELLTDVFKMAAADGRVDDAERRMIGKIAAGLGLSRDDVKACFDSTTTQSAVSPPSKLGPTDKQPTQSKGRGLHGVTPDADSPELLLVLANKPPPRGPKDYLRRVVCEIAPGRDVTGSLQVTDSYKEPSYIAQAALLSAGKNGFEADLDKLTYRSITTADGVNATVVWVFKKSQEQASRPQMSDGSQTMAQQARMLSGTGPDADVAFEHLFGNLADDDPHVRTEASRLLANSPNALNMAALGFLSVSTSLAPAFV